jgi:multidrug resistance protein
MSALDIAIVGPALPALQASFLVDSRALSWVFGIYVLFYLLSAPLMAKLSDRYGRRRIYVIDVSLFAIGSLVVVLSYSFELLLMGRAVQAFGAGGILPVASAVIGDTFPKERRGRALGLIGAVFGLAFLLGPLLGGILLHWNWRLLFLINLPLAGLVIWQGGRLLPSAPETPNKPLDVEGIVLLSAMLAAFAWALSQLNVAEFGSSVRSMAVLPFFILPLVSLPWFFWVEKRAMDPLIHPELLMSKQIQLIGVIAITAGICEAGMVFLPALLVLGLGVNEATASFMLLPLVFALIIGAPIAGRLLDALGAKRVIQAGLSLTVVGMLFLSVPELTYYSFYTAGVFLGLGLSALLGAPLRYVLIEEASDTHRGAAQGLLTLCLCSGQLGGSALVGGVAASRVTEYVGYQDAFFMVALVTGAVLLISKALRGNVPG